MEELVWLYLAKANGVVDKIDPVIYITEHELGAERYLPAQQRARELAEKTHKGQSTVAAPPVAD